jgi:hypothetical protein
MCGQHGNYDLISYGAKDKKGGAGDADVTEWERGSHA